jgi:hypothetical protein
VTDTRPDTALRDALIEEVAGWHLGRGYYQHTITSDDAAEIVDHLLAGPLADLAALPARLHDLADEWDREGGHWTYVEFARALTPNTRSST